MGFRGLSLGSFWVAFVAVFFLSACGQEEPYPNTYGNPGVVPQSGQPGQPGIPGQPDGQLGQPAAGPQGAQPQIAGGAAIGPATDNPILNPSGVIGPDNQMMGQNPQVAPVNPGQVPPNPVQGGQIQSGPPVAVAPQPVIPADPYRLTLNYFQKATLVLHGRERGFAFTAREVEKLTRMIFDMSPGFNFLVFDQIYRQALHQGYRGYIAYDVALERMGMCIATCRL